MDPTYQSFSTFSTDNLSDLFAIFHQPSKRWMMWLCRRVIPKCVSSFKLIYGTYFFHVDPLDFNWLDSFLNCSIDFKDILNYLIPWDIHYTEACTPPITKIKTPRVNTHEIYIGVTITSSIESNNLLVKQIDRIPVNRVAQVPLRAIWL